VRRRHRVVVVALVAAVVSITSCSTPTGSPAPSAFELTVVNATGDTLTVVPWRGHEVTTVACHLAVSFRNSQGPQLPWDVTVRDTNTGITVFDRNVTGEGPTNLIVRDGGSYSLEPAGGTYGPAPPPCVTPSPG
jgi:hypothetical protein